EIRATCVRLVASAAGIDAPRLLVGKPLDRVAHRRTTEPEFRCQLGLVDGVTGRDVETHQPVAERLISQIREPLTAYGRPACCASRCRHPRTFRTRTDTDMS